MNYLNRNVGRSTLKWLTSLLVVVGAQSTWADGARLELAIPGQALSQQGDHEQPMAKGWYALSLKEGVLVVEQASTSTPSDSLHVSGTQADQLLSGQAALPPAKPTGVSIKTRVDALVLMRMEEDGGGHRQLTPGQFPGAVAPDILREGWKATGKLAGRKWNFSVKHKKRPDGRLLAGSLEVVADPDIPNATRKVLLPPAHGMAFTKQELLWLGDMNSDGEPDLLLKRTWVTGEIDFVVVVSPMWATAYFDPDRPAAYFSSGVDPDSNAFEWHQGQPVPAPVKFISKGTFSIWEEEWMRLLPDRAAPMPIVLADRQFKLNGETIRVTLEHLPRAEYETPGPSSSASMGLMGGRVLVKVTFRGKSQVLMQTDQPDSGQFSLSVGLVDVQTGLKVDHQPHYNNGFTQYWIFDETDTRFRRIQIEHSQGC